MRETAEAIMRKEQAVIEKTDVSGARWRKVYFGSGAHLRNWLDQCMEVYGQDNVNLEEVDSTGLRCFDAEGEKACRIWVRD